MTAENNNEDSSHFSRPQTNEETYETEFKSLKGIAGKRLDIDEIRRERLKL
ncbi:MAG: hypothetical protein IJ697_03105 [Synergistaceae bacterium]|nr:hypothetical protein [Synergistaceae bacterium]MBR1657435.1 hypothetical protein [Synergistaceae bacterium]